MITKIHNVLSRPITYLQAKISPRQFFVLSSILVGLSSGLAAIVLKYFVHRIGTFVTYYSTHFEEFLVFALFPLIGVLLTVIYIRYALKDEFKKGTSDVVYNIVKKSSNLPRQPDVFAYGYKCPYRWFWGFNRIGVTNGQHRLCYWFELCTSI